MPRLIGGAPHVEIVGIAGSGKTTLTRTLEAEGAIRADILHTRRAAHLRHALRAVPPVGRLLATRTASGRRLDWDETKFALYVESWEDYLRSAAPRTGGLVVLDQGPLFAIARLLWGRSETSGSDRFRAWMSERLEAWSESLDAVVWLDAPDDVLLQRIHQRSQPHEAKGAAPEAAAEVLHRHRAAYAEVRRHLDRLGRPLVVDIDSSRLDPVSIAGTVWRLAAPDRARNDGGLVSGGIGLG